MVTRAKFSIILWQLLCNQAQNEEDCRWYCLQRMKIKSEFVINKEKSKQESAGTNTSSTEECLGSVTL